MGKMQREKGKRGEREAAGLIKRYGFKARRGQQFKGGAGSPDVIHNIPGVFVEVKYREKFSIYPALEQAFDESADDDVPVVLHRRSSKPWVAILRAEDFLQFMRKLEQASRRTVETHPLQPNVLGDDW